MRNRTTLPSPTSFRAAVILFSALLPGSSFAGEGARDLTAHWAGFLSLALFGIAYLLVMAEEFTHLRKSKPVVLAAGIIWAVIAGVYRQQGMDHLVAEAVRHNLLEYAELLLFLLVAMTYINAMDERRVFEVLRVWLVRRGLGFRSLFWITGLLAFFISPVADNLTTALLMCAVVLAVGGDNNRFVLLSCINIVVAANAGGAFSPFGDITTLMVWQKEIETPQGAVDFWSFFHLFLPALANWLVPAAILSLKIPAKRPDPLEEKIALLRGARRIILLFLLTIATAVAFHHFLGLPPVIGMLTGLAYLQFFGFYLKKSAVPGEQRQTLTDAGFMGDPVAFDIFKNVAHAEWDTLLFFYGVVLCVGGLGFLGYLTLASEALYAGWNPTYANVTVGLLSAIVDNIPVVFAVLSMMPDMSLGQWLLVTLTAGVGGSLLSIGSAAGVALMGQARGRYTFFGHLKWAPVIALGYAASILLHLWLNKALF